MTHTVRQRRPATSITVDPMLVQLAFPESCGRTADLTDTQMVISRAGDCDAVSLLAYNPFGRDDANRVAFRLDAGLHALPAGYYDATLLEGCQPCGTLRLDMTKHPSMNAGAPAVTLYTECPPPGEALPGTGHTDMFDEYLGWTAKLTCMLDRSTLVIKVNAALPTPLPTTPPQLVIRDGVAVETVTVVASTATSITATRGDPARSFPVGACIQFEWTEANILAVANQSCPVCPEVPDTPADGLTCTVLEAGKGIVLDTSEDGKVIVKLAATGVVAGQFNGLGVDECGRVTTVDANFPAAGIPVFDNCCKDDDEAVEP